MIRTILAPNASPLTLDGTQTYLVGRTEVAIIDPGPDSIPHLDAVADEVGGGIVVAILLTHSHPDHAEGAEAFAQRFEAPLLAWGTPGDPPLGRRLEEGERVRTDAGDLITVGTPGHTPDHLAFHLPTEAAVFVGDLMLGGMETALVSVDEGGDLGEYLASLERVRRLGAQVLYPAHGPPFTDPASTIDIYIRHRRVREQQVLDALEEGARTVDEVVEAVYGSGLAPGLVGVARGAVAAYLAHLDQAPESILGLSRYLGAPGGATRDSD